MPVISFEWRKKGEEKEMVCGRRKGKGHDDTTKGQAGAGHQNIYTGKPKQASDDQAKEATSR